MVINNCIITVANFSAYYLYEVISKHLRVDKGTETGHMATIHTFLSKGNADAHDHKPEDTVHYGPSTNNKVKC
jgi:hypothetical protein